MTLKILVLIVIFSLTFILTRQGIYKVKIFEKKKIYATIFFTLLISTSLFLVFDFVVTPTNKSYKTIGFDKDKWFSDKENRYQMSKSIMDSKILLGMTKSQVRELLGKNERNESESYWRYNLGIPPDQYGFADFDVLDIYFRNDKVYEVGQHNS